jgi:uncharacterized protein (DUF1697 family)
MPTYVAFLRAINLGATRKFPKADIVAAAEAAGCADVDTHINTGNVLVTTALRSHAKVEAALEKAFLADRGFEVPTMAFTPAEVCGIVDDAAEIAAGHRPVGGQYVSLLKEPPPARVRAEAEQTSYDGEHLELRGRVVHLLLEQRAGYHNARLGNAWVEKQIGVATNRNITVLQAIAQKWCGAGGS